MSPEKKKRKKSGANESNKKQDEVFEDEQTHKLSKTEVKDVDKSSNIDSELKQNQGDTLSSSADASKTSQIDLEGPEEAKAMPKSKSATKKKKKVGILYSLS